MYVWRRRARGRVEPALEHAVKTPFAELRITKRDDQPVWQLKCPGCDTWADIDEDQLHGRVSVDHTDTGCSYHETHDFAGSIE